MPAAAPHALPDTSPLLQVSAALLGIIILILALGWLVRRSGLVVKPGRQRDLRLDSSLNLSPREKVVVVAVDDVRLVLGVSSGQITHLHTLPGRPEPEESAPAKAPEPATFQSLLRQFRQRQSRS